MSPPKARLALAIPGAGPDPAPVGIAMLAALVDHGLRVQHFRSWACPVGTRAVGALTGLPGRHLDAWLMPPAACRSVFARGAESADLAIVEGTIEEVPASVGGSSYEDSCLSTCRRPGALLPLAEALDAPIIAAVPCDRLDQFHLPHLVRGVDAVILDGLRCRSEFSAMRRMVELVLDRPVLGALEALPSARLALRESRRDRPLDDGLAAELGRSLARCSDLDAMLTLAASRPMPPTDPSALPPSGRRFKLAYAHDDAFGDYFPDTLETLEALGAQLVEFSPLCDGDLPPGVDLVMIGCGFPDRFAEELAGNACLISALRSWVCRGRPLYAEGGGCAYLGRLMRLGDRVVPGVGLFPFDAELLPEPEPPSPVSRTLTRSGLLGQAGSILRGYHSNRWRLLPAPEPGDCPASSGFLTAERDLAFRRNAVGSLIHLHLASLPQVVSSIAGLGRCGVAEPTVGGR
ncbi:cobyrinic acid a,c-diamide synthase [Tautonia sociabilis]|uniref:Cobyrinic acid a,c-diamide synthase n=1 Tax=Tautonia sociabilis TaxID=2080755 RepID=A0A432MQJ4_9BACT|nr:cobyrinic acid a,c-diamide synthase [Tautonia sociabilis]RUL89754.1 cobyrinic acid a,c-diamide synthase [Tautonia sociabilis]